MKVQERMFSWYDVPEDIKSLLISAANTWGNPSELGKIEQAKEVSQRVREINDTSEFASSAVYDILTRPAEDEEE